MQLQTTNQRGFAPTTMGEAMQFSEMLASSSMVPKAYQGKPNDVLVCVQWGYEMGLAPMQALQNIAVINGKPSVYGDAMMALVQSSPVCEDIEEYFENEGTTNPVAVCVAKRKGRKPVVTKFSVEDAKRAGLWGKGGPWTAYPKRMLQMRARGFALRDAFPDVLKGMITAEEAQDYPDEAKPLPVAKPANPLDLVAKPVELPMAEPVVIEPEIVNAVDEVLQTVNDQITDAVTQVQAPAAIDEDDTDVDFGISTVGYALMVPGKDLPHSVHNTLDEWADAYEELAEKTAKAGKRPARERMTILKELKECNLETIGRIDTMKRVRHTANYQRRINALGAAQ
jgi:RecT family